jgi:hypothetical protein
LDNTVVELTGAWIRVMEAGRVDVLRDSSWRTDSTWLDEADDELVVFRDDSIVWYWNDCGTGYDSITRKFVLRNDSLYYVQQPPMPPTDDTSQTTPAIDSLVEGFEAILVLGTETITFQIQDAGEYDRYFWEKTFQPFAGTREGVEWGNVSCDSLRCEAQPDYCDNL